MTTTGARHIHPAAAERVRAQKRGWVAFGIVILLILGLLGGAIGGLLYLQNRLGSNLTVIEDPFKDLPSRPTTPAPEPNKSKPINILLLGSDSRISAGDPDQWKAGAQRTDAIMLMHIPSDRSGAYLMSIPRDSWVPIPGHPDAKINAAFSWGGPALAIQTVEELTGVYIDHFAVTDFEAFAAMTDALGGVEINFVNAWTSGSGTRYEPGVHRLNGIEALSYTRERYNLPGGDFDRVRRQQNWTRAIMYSAFDAGILANPLKLTEFLDVVTKSLAVDPSLNIERMRDIALSLRDVRPGDIRMLTVPYEGTGRSPDGKQSIVVLDQENFDSLMRSVATDNLRNYIAINEGNLNMLDSKVR